jgi:hypothetical protein
MKYTRLTGFRNFTLWQLFTLNNKKHKNILIWSFANLPVIWWYGRNTNLFFQSVKFINYNYPVYGKLLAC